MITVDNHLHMQELLALRQQKLEKIKLGGGAKAIAKQHEKNKLTARERIALLIDEGTELSEPGAFAGAWHVCKRGWMVFLHHQQRR